MKNFPQPDFCFLSTHLLYPLPCLHMKCVINMKSALYEISTTVDEYELNCTEAFVVGVVTRCTLQMGTRIFAKFTMTFACSMYIT